MHDGIVLAWARIRYLNSLTKKYIIGPYGSCAILYQAYITAVSLAWRLLIWRRASVRARELCDMRSECGISLGLTNVFTSPI